MTLTVTIDTSNAAFEDDPGREVARILRALASLIADGCADDRSLRDINGNKCGTAVWGES